MIGACKSEPQSYPLGKRLAALLAAELPESRARVARAPNTKRLASLITTDQLQLALLKAEEALDLRMARATFKAFKPFDLRLIFPVSEYLLVSRRDFPEKHA